MAITRGKKRSLEEATRPRSKCPRISAPSRIPRFIASSSSALTTGPSAETEPFGNSLGPSTLLSAALPQLRPSAARPELATEVMVRPRERVKSKYADTFEVLVGPQEIVYTVHKSVAARVPFFKAACSERWIEGQEKRLRLPEHSSMYFDSFMVFLYARKLDLTPLRSHASHNPRYRRLVRLWQLADYLGCPDMGNLIIDALLDRIRKWPGDTPPDCVWQYVRVGGKIWNLMVDHCAFGTPEESFDEHVKTWPIEVTQAIAKKHVSGLDKQKSSPLASGRCHYHEHGEGESCA